MLLGCLAKAFLNKILHADIVMMNSGGCCFDINQIDKQLDHNINEGAIHTVFTGSYHAKGMMATVYIWVHN